ncbi:unnamed protein product [Rotaria sordida]|uniref:LIM zinc-binding domain-containing protein n=1 Tax=Rotaria sordida TaxID=392033 RepID=A0A819VFQ3_9BILA|nr:unnamed protein product [Rotaria sordida]
MAAEQQSIGDSGFLVDQPVSYCSKCTSSIDQSHQSIIRFNNRLYHNNCFTCGICHKNLNNSTNTKIAVDNNEPVCAQCKLANARMCYVCQKPILTDGSITFDTNTYHDDCFRCCQCQKLLIDETKLAKHNSKPCCITCYDKQFAPQCSQCLKPISTGKIVTCDTKKYHSDCFRCGQCNKSLVDEKDLYEYNSKPCCFQCYEQQVAPQCVECHKPISIGKVLGWNENKYHEDCFRCYQCNKSLAEQNS